VRAKEQGPHLKHKVVRHNQVLNHSLAMSSRDMACERRAWRSENRLLGCQQKSK